jgi:hypothetical protein
MKPLWALIQPCRIYQGKIERRSPAGLRFNPDASSVTFNNTLADCQTDACSGILLSAVQALKDDEYTFGVFRINAYSVILH